MSKFRSLYAYYRYGLYLAREFRWPVIVFTALVLGGGLLMRFTYVDESSSPAVAGAHETIPYVEACYGVFMMIFMQNYLKFPHEWYLQALFFAVPIIGLGAVANSFVRMGYLIFTRKQNLPEWHSMIASTMRNHLVLCGVGKVGYRILEELLALKEEVVAIEKNAASPFVTEMLDRGVTIIIGEARLRKTLEEANVQAARAVILATDDDLANLDAALTAREIKPDIRVVLRLFDDTMANKVAATLAMPAISTASTAASALIAAATERHIFQSFSIGSRKLHVVGLTVAPRSRLLDRDVGSIQTEFGVNIVMYQGAGKSAVNPEHDVKLRPGDEFVFIAPMECIAKLEEQNR